MRAYVAIFASYIRVQGSLIDNAIYTAAPVVTFNFIEEIVEEGGEDFIFMLELDKAPDRQVMVTFRTSDGTARGNLCVVSICV